jgi:hypothetical protein
MIDQITTENMAFGFDLDDVVSEQIGVPVTLKINTLRRDLGTMHDYLSVYATLCDAAAQEDPSNILCAQTASPSAGNAMPFAFHILSHEDDAEAQQRLRLKLKHIDPQEYFYQYRIDHGIWSGFKTSDTNTVHIENPRLRLVGEHTVELRVRTKQYPYLWQSATTTLYVDRTPPTLRVHRGEKGLHLSAQDAGSSADVQLWGSFFDSKDSAWRRVAHFIPYTRITSAKADFFAQDKAGNRSAMVTLNMPDKRHPAHQSVQTQGCQANQTNVYAALLCFVFFIFRRSWRPGAVLAAHPHLKDQNHKF